MSEMKTLTIGGTTYEMVDGDARTMANSHETKIGDLSDLNTTAKTDLVSAINEAAESGGEVASVNGKTGDVVLKTSDLVNDSGYLTDYTETDPTVPEWAKQASKPSYTAAEVGAATTGALTDEAAARSTADTQLQSQINALGNGTPIPVETIAEMIDQTKAYLYTGSEAGESAGYWYSYDSTQAKFVPRGEYGAGVTIDSTLTVSGAAADAAAVGAAIEASAGSGSGLTQTEKNYILALFEKAAYTDNDASTAYAALSNLWSGYTITWNGSGFTKSNTAEAVQSGESYTCTITANTGFNITAVTVTMGGRTVAGAYSNGTVTIPNVTGNIVITVTTAQITVSSISAVYTQSGTVYDTASLDSLKSDLVVTATFMDSTTGVIAAEDYTLSGTLTEGTSTITVSYGGFTDTFSVTVTHVVSEEIIDQYTPYDSLNVTTFENVTGSAGTNNIVTDAGTINASKVRFQWDTDECSLFQIQICQYNSSGTPYKMSNLNKYGTTPITSGDAFDTTTGAWSDVGITPKFTAIAGGDITVNLPTSGKFRLQLRKTNQSTGTEVSDNATFKDWVVGDGITITAIL